jgi:ribonuclease HI
VYYDRA